MKYGFTVIAIALACATSALGQDLTGTLRKVKEKGEIVLGVREYSAPISYQDFGQEPIGYANDICARIVEDVKAKLGRSDIKMTLQPVSSPNRIPLLLNGTIDLECGSTTNTIERQKEVAFGLTYFVSNITALVKTGGGIQKLADLDGKNAIVTNGTTAVQLLTDYANAHKLKINQIVAKDHAEAFLLLRTNRGAAFVLDDIVLYSQRANAPDPKAFTVLATESLRQEPYSVVMRKDDPQLKQLVDGTLKKLIASGDIRKIYDKWFLKPIPPRGVSLEMPVSPALEEAFKNPNDKGV